MGWYVPASRNSRFHFLMSKFFSKFKKSLKIFECTNCKINEKESCIKKGFNLRIKSFREYLRKNKIILKNFVPNIIGVNIITTTTA